RFSVIPPFGIDGIHRFPPNVAEMRQWVARHFEDMLQCSILAFESLFPTKDDAIVKTLLFRLAEWHALAKLRMHSDDSLAWLNQALKKLATEIRKFQQNTCKAFKTCELPGEAAARHRSSSSTACPKSFNVLTYKFHALGDYMRTIQMFGTTDSYTTQTVSGLQVLMCHH
ncbi:hypothetical protein M404DRAFT_129317, partial [Pisolithus tinctorius Marx 270]